MAEQGKNNYDFKVRRAKADDMIAVRQMIQELADFEQMSDGPKLTVQDLIRDSGLSNDNNQHELFHCYLIEAIKINSNDSLSTELSSIPKAIGYSICFYTYSTWNGKSYFMEDIYIKPNFRGLGAGEKLFKEIIRIAKDNGCSRVDFHVLSWNPAKKFYEKFGAINLTETENWHFYRLNKDFIEKY